MRRHARSRMEAASVPRRDVEESGALGPLALISGLSLRLTKATAEVRMERERRRSRRIFAREDED